MRLLYSLGIGLYGLGVRTASLFVPKAKLMVAGWNHSQELYSRLKDSANPIVWFHASSLGEFEQARPIIEQYHALNPDDKILVTFFSPSGYEIRKDYPLADVVCYLPLDTPRNARNLVNSLNLKAAFFVKYDFWFNYLGTLKRAGIPTYIFSSIFRASQYFFKWYGKWFARQLGCFGHIFVQNQESVDLLAKVGYSKVSIVGDTRFDRVADISSSSKSNPFVERFVGTSKVLMAGSSWDPDEQNIRFVMDSLEDDVKIVLAPHVISESHINNIETLFGKSHTVRYSWLAAHPNEEVSAKVLIIDNMGMLSSIYRYATVAYIGGGFGKGIHNILEALTYGKPVVFGPNYHKFQEAHDAIKKQAGFSYAKKEQLLKLVSDLLSNESYLQEVSANAKHYVEENLGASQKILSKISIKQ